MVALCDCAATGEAATGVATDGFAGAGGADRGCTAVCPRASTHVQLKARRATAVSARVSLGFRISKRDSLVVIETNNTARIAAGLRLIQGMPIDDAGALGDDDNLLSRHVFQHLDLPARPPDFQAVHRRATVQAEM